MRYPVVLALALLLWAAPATAKTYSAERYDVRFEIQDDGSVRVTETIVLRFEDGPFETFSRAIPTRRLDALEVVSAMIDGRVLPWGDGAGQAEISGGSTRRVTWRFEPVEYAQHEFTLVYRLRGVIRQSDSADQILWRALPSDHEYQIDSSLVTVATTADLAAAPDIRTRRVGATSTIPDRRGLVVSAKDIRRDGWVELRLTYPKSALVAAPPAWQQAREAANASAPYWIGGAVLLALVGLIPLVALRAGYRSPPDDRPIEGGSITLPPDDIPPAMAGTLLAKGTATGGHALATLFALADRGVVTITETDTRSFGRRQFEVRKQESSAPLTNIERLVLDSAFRRKGRTESSVGLVEASRRLQRSGKPFRAAMHDAIVARGLWDEDRATIRRRHIAIAVVLVITAIVWAPIALLLLDRFLAWPLLPSVGLGVAAMVLGIVASTRTPLSNDGLRRAARWRAYAGHLKAIARGKATLERGPASRLLATAVALGLSADWARYLKKHPGQLPEWFHSTAEDGAASMAALVAAVSASSGSAGGAGAGAGGAAGGGSSGAS